jgi:hypothetical protein
MKLWQARELQVIISSADKIKLYIQLSLLGSNLALVILHELK